MLPQRIEEAVREHTLEAVLRTIDGSNLLTGLGPEVSLLLYTVAVCRLRPRHGP